MAIIRERLVSRMIFLLSESTHQFLHSSAASDIEAIRKLGRPVKHRNQSSVARALKQIW